MVTTVDLDLPIPVHIRAARIADLAEMADLDRINYTFPWDLQIFTDCFQVGYTMLVIAPVNATGLWGYGVLSVGAQEGHILNVSVHPNHQRQGLGYALMQALLASAQAQGAERTFLEVRRSTSVAQRLYQRLGFEKIGERKGYYLAPDGQEDALVMQYIHTSPDVSGN